jgi:hypothetical protein
MLKNKPATDDTWRGWSTSLRQWGLEDVVAQVLDSAGSLTVFFAQLVYFCQPFLYNILPSKHLQGLADILEDRDQAKAFAAYLRQGDKS